MSGGSADIDEASLESYLSRELDTSVVDLEVIHDGLNLSLAISTATRDRAYVLRRPNKLRQTESFNELSREYQVLKRLQRTALETPKPVILCEDTSVIGDPFLVMTLLDGEVIPLGSDLPSRFQTLEARRAVGHRLIDTLVDIQSVDIDDFDDVCERVSTRKQLTRTLDRLEQVTSVTGHEPPRLDSVVDWLEANVPSRPTTTLIHGDYRPGNVLFGTADTPEVTGIIDWETAFLGDPLTELGYLLLRWRDEADPAVALSEIESRHDDGAPMDDLVEIKERGMAPFTSEPGSPTRSELISRYEALTGRTFDNARFYIAFSAVMLATVWEDLHRFRLSMGATSNREPYIEYMVLLANSIITGDFDP